MTCPHCGQTFDPFPAFPSAVVDAVITQMQTAAAVRRREQALAAWEQQQREAADVWREIRQAREGLEAMQRVEAGLIVFVKK